MATVEEIFRAFGGPASLAKIIGVTTEHASAMRRRNSIPVKYWPFMLRASSGFEGGIISDKILIEAHSTSKNIEKQPSKGAR